QSHHRVNQMIKYLRRVLAPTSMHRRGLDNGAAGRDEPVEAFPLRQLANRPGLRSTSAYSEDSCQMRPDGFNIQRRIERQQPLSVQFDAGFEEFAGRARDYHADVDELLTLDFGDDADGGVIIGTVIVHEAPPPEKHAVQPAGSASIQRKRPGAGRYC